jgi:GH15 family glucan-1,4-alpha-glucosidase
LTCAIHLAELGQIPGRVGRWRTERDAIRAFVQSECWDPALGCYTRYPGTTELDASVLLAGDFDDGPQMSSTIDLLRAQLGAGPLLYRYTGMDKEEGAFLACSFWIVSALARVGRVDEARELMTELLSSVNDVGILAEMIDPASGSFLGNIPQGLSHLSLINAAAAVSDAAPSASGGVDARTATTSSQA